MAYQLILLFQFYQLCFFISLYSDTDIEPLTSSVFIYDNICLRSEGLLINKYLFSFLIKSLIYAIDKLRLITGFAGIIFLIPICLSPIGNCSVLLKTETLAFMSIGERTKYSGTNCVWITLYCGFSSLYTEEDKIVFGGKLEYADADVYGIDS